MRTATSARFSLRIHISAPHRFAGRCDALFPSQRRPENTRTECPHRIFWLTGCRVFRTESPPRCYLAPTRDARTLRKLKRGLVSPITAFDTVRMRLPKRFKNRSGSGMPLSMSSESVFSSIQRRLLSDALIRTCAFSALLCRFTFCQVRLETSDGRLRQFCRLSASVYIDTIVWDRKRASFALTKATLVVVDKSALRSLTGLKVATYPRLPHSEPANERFGVAA